MSEVIVQSDAVPPMSYDDGQERPLASIPLSKLMQREEVVCPLCGRKLPPDTKEAAIDGATYTVCKTCPKR